MATAGRAVEYPQIVKTPGVRGGKARIDGTRICVVDVAIAYQQGHKPEAIQTHFSSRPLTLYRRYYHMPIYATNPGVAGATFLAPDANHVGCNRLNAASELLYMEADVHADWDAASDLLVEVRFVVNVNERGRRSG